MCNLITWSLYILGIVVGIWYNFQDTAVGVCAIGAVLTCSVWLWLGSTIQGQYYSSPCYADE